ncbi:MAG: metalloregulator ArsR/SmtB family transcription factor [Cypionkella sp.]|nr:metalloregulator ArsR/SmtB family transcription factor [Cypionkella sp.]
MSANIIFFRALGDPRRLRIIEVLANGPRNVGQISAHLGIAQSGVSRHLRILTDSGFVRARASGQERIYALQPEAFVELGDWAARYSAHLAPSLPNSSHP